MQKIAEFYFIGHIGKIDAAKDVTHLSVAANYNHRDGNEMEVRSARPAFARFSVGPR